MGKTGREEQVMNVIQEQKGVMLTSYKPVWCRSCKGLGANVYTINNLWDQIKCKDCDGEGVVLRVVKVVWDFKLNKVTLDLD